MYSKVIQLYIYIYLHSFLDSLETETNISSKRDFSYLLFKYSLLCFFFWRKKSGSTEMRCLVETAGSRWLWWKKYATEELFPCLLFWYAVSSPLDCQNRCRQLLQLPFLLEEGCACLAEKVMLIGIASAHADGAPQLCHGRCYRFEFHQQRQLLQGISHLLNKELWLQKTWPEWQGLAGQWRESVSRSVVSDFLQAHRL